MLDRTPQRGERPFVAEVLEAEVPVHPYQQVGTALRGADHLHDHPVARREPSDIVLRGTVVDRTRVERGGFEAPDGERGRDRPGRRMLIGSSEGQEQRRAGRRAEREREERLGRELEREQQLEERERGDHPDPARRQRWFTNGARMTNDAARPASVDGLRTASRFTPARARQLVDDLFGVAPPEPPDRARDERRREDVAEQQVAEEPVPLQHQRHDEHAEPDEPGQQLGQVGEHTLGGRIEEVEQADDVGLEPQDRVLGPPGQEEQADRREPVGEEPGPVGHGARVADDLVGLEAGFGRGDDEVARSQGADHDPGSLVARSAAAGDRCAPARRQPSGKCPRSRSITRWTEAKTSSDPAGRRRSTDSTGPMRRATARATRSIAGSSVGHGTIPSRRRSDAATASTPAAVSVSPDVEHDDRQGIQAVRRLGPESVAVEQLGGLLKEREGFGLPLLEQPDERQLLEGLHHEWLVADVPCPLERRLLTTLRAGEIPRGREHTAEHRLRQRHAPVVTDFVEPRGGLPGGRRPRPPVPSRIGTVRSRPGGGSRRSRTTWLHAGRPRASAPDARPRRRTHRGGCGSGRTANPASLPSRRRPRHTSVPLRRANPRPRGRRRERSTTRSRPTASSITASGSPVRSAVRTAVRRLGRSGSIRRTHSA